MEKEWSVFEGSSWFLEIAIMYFTSGLLFDLIIIYRLKVVLSFVISTLIFYLFYW